MIRCGGVGVLMTMMMMTIIIIMTTVITFQITGDHLQTAIHVAKLCGISDKPTSHDLKSGAEDLEMAVPDLNTDMLVVSATADGQSIQGQLYNMEKTSAASQRHTLMTLEEKDLKARFKKDDNATHHDCLIAVEGSALPHLMQLAASTTTTMTTSAEKKEEEEEEAGEKEQRSFARSLILQTSIFARIQPAQKTFIVETLVEEGLVAGMCGDGTNDCGALKAAHFGISLSCAEASIVSPFTSKNRRITDCLEVIREGRCALTTSFLAFKFMILYPVIQVRRLYERASERRGAKGRGSKRVVFSHVVRA